MNTATTAPHFSQAVLDKARRLVAEERVTPVGAADLWRVQGDTGPRTVAVLPHDTDPEGIGAVCTCPDGDRLRGGSGRCSHVAAVALVIRAEGDVRPAEPVDADPFAGLDDLA